MKNIFVTWPGASDKQNLSISNQTAVGDFEKRNPHPIKVYWTVELRETGAERCLQETDSDTAPNWETLIEHSGFLFW